MTSEPAIRERWLTMHRQTLLHRNTSRVIEQSILVRQHRTTGECRIVTLNGS